MRLKIYHRTEYHYEKSVHHSIQELRLIPRTEAGQLIHSWKIYAPARLTESVDAFGNLSHIFVMETNYADMILEAEGEVETSAAYEYFDEPNSLSPYYSLQQTDLTDPSEKMVTFFKSNLPTEPSIPQLLELAEAVKDKIVYITGSTHFETKAAESFELGAGVCQDHAHIMLGLCRESNIPARYVSGYFHASSSPNLASHAWVDVCVDIDKGHWISIDVTHACLTDERHVRLAIGRDYTSAAPVKGVRSGGGKEELLARISIQEC